MKKSVLAFDSALRRNSLRQLLRVLLGCLRSASAVVASTQEKTRHTTHAAGWVVIPVNEYRVLRAKAYPVEPIPNRLRWMPL